MNHEHRCNLYLRMMWFSSTCVTTVVHTRIYHIWVAICFVLITTRFIVKNYNLGLQCATFIRHFNNQHFRNGCIDSSLTHTIDVWDMVRLQIWPFKSHHHCSLPRHTIAYLTFNSYNWYMDNLSSLDHHSICFSYNLNFNYIFYVCGPKMGTIIIPL